jgi:electron transfer flavoprotein alpha subunit
VSDDLGLAGIYETMAPREDKAAALEDVKSSDWRNVLVLGRATPAGVHPETLALVGRARYIADELGCRVEVLLIGDDLEPATAALKKFPIDTIYRVQAPDYAPIDHTARILEAAVRKRRPEMVLVFQSRTGDAITAYAASRLATGFCLGAAKIEVDTSRRLAQVAHESGGASRLQVVTAMQQAPQFISVQTGLFRAPMEDPYGNAKVHDLAVDAGKLAPIEVLGRRAPPAPKIAKAERVLVAGARIRDRDELELARRLAQRLDAVFAVTIGIVERGLADDTTAPIVGEHYNRIAPRLLVAVGVRGALDFLEAIDGQPTICAIGGEANDPIAKRASYMVAGDVKPAVESVLAAL